MLESDVERILIKGIKKIGGLPLKFVSPGAAGVPDRICIFPGKVYFVEVKRPGQTLRPLQKIVINRLRRMDQKVFTVSSPDEVAALISFIESDRYKVGGQL